MTKTPLLRTTCILKIYQEYCDKILSGAKSYEFRKQCPDWMTPGCEVVLCSCDAPSVLLAWFRIGEITVGSPGDVWKRTNERGGVDLSAFQRYYDGQDQAFALEITTLRKFKTGKTVASIMGDDYVPHSFDLLTQEQATAVRNNLLGKSIPDGNENLDVHIREVTAASDDAIGMFFMEDASRIRRVVQLMPGMNPSAEFLNALWLYAKRHNRLADLANLLLGFDAKHPALEGNGNCDWFWRCNLPVVPEPTNEFYFDLMTFARARAHLERGTFDDWHDNSLAMLEALESYKHHGIASGIIGIDEVLDQLRKKYESEVEEEQESRQ